MQKRNVFIDPTQALNSIGLTREALQSINAIDVIKRVPTMEHPRTKNGWIIPFYDGSFLAGNWETGETALYSTKGTSQHNRNEMKILYRLAEINSLKRARERELQYSREAKTALKFWNRCKSIGKPLHPYLERKQVIAVSTIRETHINELKIFLGVYPKTNGARVLVIPLVYQNALASLQFITESGEKLFLAGARTGGCYWQSHRDSNPRLIGIAEGVATTLSVIQHSAEPMLGVSAMNAGNLPKVAQAIHAKYPNAQIDIYGDTDANNVGQKRAKEAQKTIGGNTGLFIPRFTKDMVSDFKAITGTDKTPTDWNDYYLLRGASR